MVTTYSNVANAVRGFRSANADNTLSGTELRAMVAQVAPGRFAVVVPAPTPVVADVVGYNPALLLAAPAHVVSKPMLKGIPMLRKSAAKGAVAKAHELFGIFAQRTGDDMTRKGAIAFAVDNGIAFFTARTQYQRWSHAFG